MIVTQQVQNPDLFHKNLIGWNIHLTNKEIEVFQKIIHATLKTVKMEEQYIPIHRKFYLSYFDNNFTYQGRKQSPDFVDVKIFFDT